MTRVPVALVMEAADAVPSVRVPALTMVDPEYVLLLPVSVRVPLPLAVSAEIIVPMVATADVLPGLAADVATCNMPELTVVEPV
jgi:hypothetical protein